MRAIKTTTLWLAMLPALGACTMTQQDTPSGNRLMAAPAQVSVSAQGGPLWGTSVATMADQYDRPHPGPVGTGASSWVGPPPAPAYVDTSAPPPRAPDPAPLAAVANRQPSTPAARPAAPDAERPEIAMANGGSAAAAPSPAPRVQPASGLSAAEIAKGRSLFADNGCGGCHKLEDAGGTGGIGPSFDGNRGLTRQLAITTIHDGRGAMPPFAGQLSDADIRTLAGYIVQAKK